MDDIWSCFRLIGTSKIKTRGHLRSAWESNLIYPVINLYCVNQLNNPAEANKFSLEQAIKINFLHFRGPLGEVESDDETTWSPIKYTNAKIQNN